MNNRDTVVITSSGFGQYLLAWGFSLTKDDVNKLANYARELEYAYENESK